MSLPRILYFEDDDNDADLLRNQLDQEGMKVDLVRVDTPHAFLEALKVRPPSVVVTDSEIIGFTAAAVLHAVKTVHPEVPVYCLTGLVTEKKAALLRAAGVVETLSKDDLSLVAATLRKAIARTGA